MSRLAKKNFVKPLVYLIIDRGHFLQLTTPFFIHNGIKHNCECNHHHAKE